jgi:hypothetical protein
MECYSAIKRGRIPSCAGRWTTRLSEKSQTQANIMFSLICGIQGKKKQHETRREIIWEEGRRRR